MNNKNTMPKADNPPSPDQAQKGEDNLTFKPPTDHQKFNLILDIPLEFSVELGKAKMPVSDLLSLKVGSTIALDKLAGEPMEILINRKLVARGEIVVVKEKLGVRLTDIITPIERIRGQL